MGLDGIGCVCCSHKFQLGIFRNGVFNYGIRIEKSYFGYIVEANFEKRDFDPQEPYLYLLYD